MFSYPGALLLSSLLACRGCKGPDTSSRGDDSFDSGEASPSQMPWDEPGFWTDPGPLEPLLDPEIDTTDTTLWYVVFMATSEDGITWKGSAQPIVKAMNSLDLWITDDGIILQGLVQPGLDVQLDEGTVYGIQSTDLLTWTSHAWAVEGLDGPKNLVDPSLAIRSPNVPMLTYYKADFADPGDPIDTEGTHEIWRAFWDGERWINEREVYEGEGLADPAICLMDGVEWLFLTEDAERVVVAPGDDGTFTEAPELTWEGHAVPYCQSSGDSTTVVAQPPGGIGMPVQREFQGDGWGPESNLMDGDPWGYGQCASPVVGQYQDQWVAFCAVDWLAYLGSIGALGRPEAPGG